MSYRKTLLIDFDGVLHSYTGWKGPAEQELGPPIDKARHAILLLAKEFRIVCFTTRPAELVELWLRRHGFPAMKVTNYKEAAFLIIDDRAICFDGTWNDALLERIRNFKTHWEGSLPPKV